MERLLHVVLNGILIMDRLCESLSSAFSSIYLPIYLVSSFMVWLCQNIQSIWSYWRLNIQLRADSQGVRLDIWLKWTNLTQENIQEPKGNSSRAQFHWLHVASTWHFYKGIIIPPAILKHPLYIYFRVEARHRGPGYVLYRAMTYWRSSINATIFNINGMSNNEK